MRAPTCLRLLAFAALLFAGSVHAAPPYDLGKEFAAPEAWQALTWAEFGARHSGSRFSVTAEGVRNLFVADYSYFGYPLCEAEVVFGSDGVLKNITVSLFNKGDAGSTATETEAFAAVESLPFFVGKKATSVVGDGRGKTITYYDWVRGDLTVEAAIGISAKESGARQVEYVIVKMMKGSAAETPRASLIPTENLRREGTALYIDGIPMVQQGRKGYCAPATLARILGYFGIETDMHELALLLETDVGGGTRINAAFPSLTHVAQEAGLTRTDYWRLGAETKPTLEAFENAVRFCIDRGWPLIWGVSRTFAWDSSAGQGAHMRLIIGYDAARGEVLYSDSWGASSALKRASWQAAYEVTDLVITLHPPTSK